jgi:hypothetical protein
MRRLGVIMFVLGATLGSALDAIHTWSGMTAYPSPVFLRAAWWTPLAFGVAGLATGLAYPWLERSTRRDVAVARTPREALVAFAAFTLLYLVSGFWRAESGAKAAVVAFGAVYMWLRFARTRAAALMAIAAAIVGPAVEAVLVATGLFLHLKPDVLGVPLWLPPLYAAGSIASGLVGLVLSLSLPSSAARSLP